MKKWLCRGGVVLLLGIIGLAIGYEVCTQTTRGLLRGEAFFDGRPTSYWRDRIDRWAARNHSYETAANLLAMTPRRKCEFDVVVVRFT